MNYAKWQVFYAALPYLDDISVASYDKFLKATDPSEATPSEREEICFKKVLGGFMPLALARIHADYVLDEKSVVSSMFTDCCVKIIAQ